MTEYYGFAFITFWVDTKFYAFYRKLLNNIQSSLRSYPVYVNIVTVIFLFSAFSVFIDWKSKNI